MATYIHVHQEENGDEGNEDGDGELKAPCLVRMMMVAGLNPTAMVDCLSFKLFSKTHLMNR